MQIRNLVFLGVGLGVGAALLVFLRCERPPKPPQGLVDGKYLVVETATGHSIYEATPGGLKIRFKDWSPEGLHAIWELQSAYQPKSVLSGGEELLYIPITAWNTETKTFGVDFRFYKVKDDKLVEIPREIAGAQK